jgi:hypothetical protein
MDAAPPELTGFGPRGKHLPSAPLLQGIVESETTSECVASASHGRHTTEVPRLVNNTFRIVTSARLSRMSGH